MRGLYCREKIKGKECRRNIRGRVLTRWEGGRITLKKKKNISVLAFRPILKDYF